MKVAKASNEDLKSTELFLMAAELALDGEKFSFNSPEDKWEDLDEDDEDFILIQKIKKEQYDEDGFSDNRIIMYEFLRRKFAAASCDWRRVYWAADLLIDNFCDPTDNCLAPYPGIELFHVANEQ